jgi:RHS repeat-associated protein
MYYLRFLLCLVALTLSATEVAAQVQNPAVSAAAFAYGKYADIPVNHHSGTGSVSVPIHTISDGPLSLPVYLQYHTAGNLVGTPASDVGLGWNLNTGGMISRTIRDRADDHDKGYYHRGDEIRMPYSDLNHPSYDLDSEPDIFTYSIAGQNGKFFFDANQVVQMIPKSDIKIEVIVDNDRFDAFLLTATDGTKYYFGEYNNNAGIDAFAYDLVAFNSVPTTSNHRVGWSLMAVVAPDEKHWIAIEYELNRYFYRTPKACGSEFKYRRNNGSISTVAQCNYPFPNPRYYAVSFLPKRITNQSGNGEITFNYSDREDLWDVNNGYITKAKHISEIEITDGDLCVSYDLDHEYFRDDVMNIPYSKLKLNSIQRKSCGGSLSEPAWEFDYHGRTTSTGQQFAPATINHDIDHWGYYNFDASIGANNPSNDLTPSGTGMVVGGSFTPYGTANRETNEAAMKEGTLERVTYPTGGNLKLTVEANRYKKDGLRRISFDLYHEDIFGIPYEEQYYNYTASVHNAVDPRWELCITPESGAPPFSASGKVEIFTMSGTRIAILSTNPFGSTEQCIDGSMPNVGFGNQAMVPGQTYRIRVTSVNADSRFRITYEDDPTEAICGGLRLERTKIHDGITAARDIIQNFKYNSANYPNVSSGILSRLPKYAYRINSRTALFTANSFAPLNDFNGYHIGYGRVVVDKNGIGETEHLYTTSSTVSSSTNALFPIKPTEYFVDKGVMEASTVYDENGNDVSNSTTTRNTSDYYTYFGGSTTTGIIFSGSNVPWYSGGSLSYRNISTSYRLRTSIYRPKTVTSTVDGVTTVTQYNYNSNNLLPGEVLSTNSNGDEHKVVNTYTSDYPTSSLGTEMAAKNMVHLPYITNKYYNGDQVDGSQLSYRFYRLDGTSPSTSTSGRLTVPRVYQKSRYEKTWDANGTLTGSGWRTAATYSKYNSDGLLHQFNRDGWASTYLYYNNKRLSSKNFNGHTETFSYYPNNSTRLQQTTAVDGTTTSYTYDDLGRLETVTDDCKNVTNTYDYRFGWGGQNINYVEVETDYPSPDVRSQLDEITTRQYKDGLGRDIVQVSRNVGPNSNEDIITGVEYDKFGRVVRSYEPYARANNFGNYRATSSSRDHTLHAYETSPLSRKTTVTPPDWHATIFNYGTNASSDQVKKDGTSSYYPAGTLMKQITTDPNGNKLIAFTDKLGQRILSRRTNASDAASKRLDTYYLHDGKGRLKSVVPPGAVLSNTNLIFDYLYDDEDQVIQKRIPGKAPINYRYNTKDLLGAYQDGNLLAEGKWYAYNYDNFGRPTTEGFRTASIPSAFSNLSLSETLAENIYGTSSWEKDKIKTSRTKVLGSSTWLQTTNNWSTCGLLTSQAGNNHRNTSLSAPETTSYTYDGADNLTESTYNHRFPGANRAIRAEHHYDYAGRNMRNYFQVGNGANKKINRLYYDEKNNVSRKRQGGTNLSGTNAYLQEINYHYLANGLLEGINLNGLTGNQVSLPSWGNTAPIVDPGTPSSATYDAKDLFYLQLYRDQRPTTNDGSAAPAARSNGDISFVATQVRGRDQMLFGIKYDEYDRMRDARFYERSSATATAIYGTHYWETAAYDERGNITDLNRRGTYVNNNLYYEQGFDDLDYTYQANSNRLHSIDDATSNARGYHEQPGTYDYDDNGNTTYDPSRKIIIAYNHLNLPTSIRWLSSGQQRIELTYDAAGTMLTRKRINSSGTTEEIRDYIGGIEYVDNALESVHHAEGRVYFGGSTERYDYALTDHLGNTRLLYSDLNNNGVPEVPGEIIQEKHYYPFGMKMTGPWMGAAAGAKIAYQYNGIEHVDDFDLNVNMAMYRTLDPVIGRWWSVDPKGESFTDLSPYNSMMNSPMVYTDPYGDEPITLTIGLIAGITGAGFNIWQNRKEIFTDGGVNWGKFAYAGVIGAGAALAGVAAAPAAIIGGTALATAGSFAVAGAVAGSVGGGLQGFGNAFVFRSSDDLGQDILSGTFRGAVGGAVVGGVLGGVTGLAAHWLHHFVPSNPSANQVPDEAATLVDDIEGVVTLDNPIQPNGGKSPFAKKVSLKQQRHLQGSAGKGKGFLNSMQDAQSVLDAVHNGQAQFLGNTNNGFPVFKYSNITGTNVNLGAGFPAQPTNVFIIKGTTRPSIVPTNPLWTPK